MSILSDPLNIILLMVVAFVGYRLWQVLGARTGFERSPQPQTFKTEPKPTDLVLEAKPDAAKPVWEGFASEGSELAKGLLAISAVDPGFAPIPFLAGAKIAHERILEAFAKSDLQTLKPLLAKESYADFEKEIARRKQAGESTVFKFIGVNSNKLVAARLEGKIAEVDVHFASQVISVLKSKAGDVISGDERKVTDVSELWTFERDVTSTDPNWKLAETHEQD